MCDYTLIVTGLLQKGTQPIRPLPSLLAPAAFSAPAASLDPLSEHRNPRLAHRVCLLPSP